MTRLQKKCLVGSAFFHGLMVVVFLATAAFRSRTTTTITEAQVLTLVPTKILDRLESGGQSAPAIVNPLPSPPAARPAPPSPQPQPAPPAPTRIQPPPAPPAPPRPQLQPSRSTPPKPAATTTARQPADTKPAPVNPIPRPGATRRGITVDLSQITPSTRGPSRSADAAAQERAAAQAANAKRIQQEVAAAFASLDSSVHSKDNSVAVATLPGEGGGEAFASYDTAVKSAYYNAWSPELSARKTAVSDVKIVVSRNGSITSSEFVSKSGDPLLDRSVQRALDAVKQLPPFPPGATDLERTFIIRFNPETLPSAG